MALLTYFHLYIMVINLLSYNPTGILQESKRAFISDLLAENKVDIAFLQETWLLKSNTMLITEISEDYFFSYAIYFCFGLPPYFIGEYHSLIFLLAENGILSPD